MIGQPCGCESSCVKSIVCNDAPPVTKPIRVIQFLSVAAVFALTVYTISRETPYKKTEEILLITLYTSYLFITVVDMISQFCGDPIPDTPMFLFGMVGMILFLTATCGIYFVTNRPGIVQTWQLTTSIALSAICSLLYVLDIFLIYLYGY